MDTFVIVNKDGDDAMPNAVDICLIVDRSGSMNSMVKETYLGVENFVKDQKETASDTGIPTNITIKTFDDYCWGGSKKTTSNKYVKFIYKRGHRNY